MFNKSKLVKIPTELEITKTNHIKIDFQKKYNKELIRIFKTNEFVEKMFLEEEKSFLNESITLKNSRNGKG
jgi:hypothetical protein